MQSDVEPPFALNGVKFGHEGVYGRGRGHPLGHCPIPASGSASVEIGPSQVVGIGDAPLLDAPVEYSFKKAQNEH